MWIRLTMPFYQWNNWHLSRLSIKEQTFALMITYLYSYRRCLFHIPPYSHMYMTQEYLYTDCYHPYMDLLILHTHHDQCHKEIRTSPLHTHSLLVSHMSLCPHHSYNRCYNHPPSGRHCILEKQCIYSVNIIRITAFCWAANETFYCTTNVLY